MWFKVDDKFHSHPKTRRLLRSRSGKRRDAGAVGLWVLAGDWCADNAETSNGSEGFVPLDELERWDDDWEALAKQLVDVGYWEETERHGEPGYLFHDWGHYQPEAMARKALREARSEAGRKGGIASGKARAKQGSKREALASSKTNPVPSRPDPTPKESMADQVSQLPVVEANGKRWTMTEIALKQIADETGGDRAWALAISAEPLGKAKGEVISAGAFVLKAVRAEPDRYRYQSRPPTKAEQCPKHPGQRATKCGPCAADRIAGDHDE